MEDELTPTLVNSYGSAKHTRSTLMDNPLSIDSASGQWNGRGVTWGKAGFDSLEGELPLVHSIPFLVCSIKTQV